MTAIISERMGTHVLIELEGVTKVYGTGQAAMQALRGIDLHIDRGEFVAVRGPSGSGKSNCMNILAAYAKRIVHFFDGRVETDQRNGVAA